jgi:hypothetical protein
LAAAAADGPLPVGDVIGATILICALVYDAVTDDDPPDCDGQFAMDLASCRAIGRRNKSRAARCYEAALARKIACEEGRPLPPLHGWN